MMHCVSPSSMMTCALGIHTRPVVLQGPERQGMWGGVADVFGKKVSPISFLLLRVATLFSPSANTRVPWLHPYTALYIIIRDMQDHDSKHHNSRHK